MVGIFVFMLAWLPAPSVQAPTVAYPHEAKAPSSDYVKPCTDYKPQHNCTGTEQFSVNSGKGGTKTQPVQCFCGDRPAGGNEFSVCVIGKIEESGARRYAEESCTSRCADGVALHCPA